MYGKQRVPFDWSGKHLSNSSLASGDVVKINYFGAFS